MGIARVQSLVRPILIIAAAASLTISIAACEPGAELTFENRTNVDVSVFHEAVYLPSGNSRRIRLGDVPAGHIVKPEVVVVLLRSTAGDRLVFKAEDAAGRVIWQQTWSFEEFLDLERSDWYICICP